uniref:Uncharacterized protein n=1 Tax=Cajanus cajan TaxID=3821 RepID=A0A151QRY9_CAJCA|nr:hypothetical protein KK1_046109 [Cajanus cajan]
MKAKIEEEEKQRKKKKKKGPPSWTKEKGKEVSSLEANVPLKKLFTRLTYLSKMILRKHYCLNNLYTSFISKRHSLPLVMNLSLYLKRSKHF